MKVVLDTNIFLSSFISVNNPPDLIIRAWLEGCFELLTSEEQLYEIRRITRYPHLQRYCPPHKAGTLVNHMRKYATVVYTDLLKSEEAADPEDNFLIAICEAGGANVLVTGDRRAGLLQRKHIASTEVLTARQFAEKYLKWRLN